VASRILLTVAGGDALYIRLRGTTVTTRHLGEGIAADCDSEGHLACVKILDALKRLGDRDGFRQVTVKDLAMGGEP